MAMWGELWEYPFQAEVWGTVAAWAGSLVSSIAIGAAALYYIMDRKRENKAQASRVRFIYDDTSMTEDQPALRVVVHNYSGDDIYDISCHWGRLPFRDVALDWHNIMSTQEEKEELYKYWIDLPRHKYISNILKQRRLSAGGNKRFAIDEGPQEYVAYWVEYYDAVGRRWKLDLNASTPIPIKDKVSRTLTFYDIIRHTQGTKLLRNRRRKTKEWLQSKDLNPP